jgi:hypothetical protein
MLQIVEILRPAEQGRTTPFLCRGEDDRLYYVKGLNTGRQGQWCEWLAGHLGQAFGLPIPPFQIVDVPAELLEITCPEWKTIGAGPAFASLAQEGCQWLEPSMAGQVPTELRRDVLVFDWWIRNSDRFGDNTNLLWDGAAKRLAVIDHDLAFNPELWPTLFRDQHVFSGDWDSTFGDLMVQADYATRLEGALPAFDVACDNVPPAWRWETVEMTRPFRFDLDIARATLARCSTPDFWRMV